MGLILSIVISILTSIIILKGSKYIVEQESEFKGEYGVSISSLIMIMVVTTVVIFINFKLYLFIKLWILFVVILFTAIVDHYTHYVYSSTMIISYIFIIACLVLLKEHIYLKESLIIAASFFVFAKLTGKWYGDVQVIALITLALGLETMIPILLIACFMALILFIFKRSRDKEIAFCPMILVGYLSVILILTVN